ncbi:O-antigen ligase [uncultured Adlercreutzia sp.]|uniref:O-antigen ligase family protein n=1 Tax=uncultured Adlercreutzia sp. TaxID=875803 RepID=UPI0026F385F6|nr:O-antigen ligase family protein [uncultured Adlercreutzia sp.]
MADNGAGGNALVIGGLFLAFLFLLRPDVNSSLAFVGVESPLPGAVWRIAIVAVTLLCAALFLVRKRADRFFVLLSACLAWVFATTVINGGGFESFCYDWLPLYAAGCLAGAFAGRGSGLLIRALYGACMFYLAANAVGMLASGDVGFQSQTRLFFGIRTVTFRVAIPAMVCSFLIDEERGRRASFASVSACLLSLFDTFVGYSAAALFVIICLVLIRIGCCFAVVRSKLNIAVYAGVVAVGFLGTVVFRLQDRFGWFIENVLQRRVTLSGRVEVWDAVFALLANSHLLYGYGASYLWTKIYVDGQLFMHAHNDILHLLMTGGIALLLLVGGFFYVAVKPLFKARSHLQCALLAAGIFGFLLIGVFEVSACVGLMALLALSFYVSGESESERSMGRLVAMGRLINQRR